MIRTQVYLTEEQRKQIQASGAGLAEFVRAAVDERIQQIAKTPADRWKILEKAAGLWKDRDFTGDEYQTRMRRRRRKD